jgi:DNA repair protein RecN (Recombination protein N)
MLEFLKVKNIALVDEIEIEFGDGLNLLTGETGSGKSIIVDSLGTLTGGRVSSDIVKAGQQSAQIEGLFTVRADARLREVCDSFGIDLDEGEQIQLIVRRELSLSGKNRIFINGQLATQAALKQIGPFLVAIHGQGEQAALFDTASHMDILDGYAGLAKERERVAETYREWNRTRSELTSLRTSEAEKLQLLDVLRFQIDEIKKAGIRPNEDMELGEEKRRLSNVEKLSALSGDAYSLLYEAEDSTVATLEKASRKVEELATYDQRFADYIESLQTALAVIEDLAITARDFGTHLEFSPERLEEIENRLAEISRLTRKYGGTIETVLDHLRDCEERLERIETSELREKELRAELAARRSEYLDAASALHTKRTDAAVKYGRAVEGDLRSVALDKARFEVRVDPPTKDELTDEDFTGFSANGFDKVEFFFSANPGEEPKPLARVASGGEASRLMLILKTTAGDDRSETTAVFDEVDSGIGGRVAEAVGLKLKALSASQQVLCVTHQPQVASKADRHILVEKQVKKDRTLIKVRELDAAERVEEIARMLAGEKVTDAARENARELIAAAG